MRILLHLTVGILLTFSVSACGETDTPDTDPEPLRLGEIFDHPDGDLFAKAVVTAGLVDTLNEPGPFTLFSPKRDSVKALLTKLNLTEEEFLARDDLADFVLNHVIEGSIGEGEFTDGATLQTLAGETLTVEVRDDGTFVDGARIVSSSLDWQIINGNFHTIDDVLVPPGFGEED